MTLNCRKYSRLKPVEVDPDPVDSKWPKALALLINHADIKSSGLERRRDRDRRDRTTVRRQPRMIR
jgi:hypothetical protein